MTKIEEIANAVVAELTLAYMQAGGHISTENSLAVAKSLCEALGFANADEVHEAFRRAKEVQDIPTQRTLSEALKNHRAETLPKPDRKVQRIEYRKRRDAWLPTDTMRRSINLQTAIKNYCAALGGEHYREYCRTHATSCEKHQDCRTVRWLDDERALAFDEPIKDRLRTLYTKYWRMLPASIGYPEDERLNLGLMPPSVDEFRVMIANENNLTEVEDELPY